MKIGNFKIGKQPFIIAEAGLNHNGSLQRVQNMVYAAKRAGADCIKFQTYKTDEFCRKDDPLYYVFKQSELPDDAWPRIKRMCDEAGIMFLSTPQNRSDLDLLLPLGIMAIKVGSDDFCNVPLINNYANCGLPLLLSTGMTQWEDLIDVQNEIWYKPIQAVFMVCTSQYPTMPEEVNVNRIKKILSIGYKAGFSDHTVGNTAATMAVAIGASVFEKHFTLDKALPGPDHEWACNPDELASWVSAIREAWVMRGSGSFELSEKEAEQKRKYQRKPGQQLRGEQ